ncbi:MAG: HDOD domain-containing protein [Spirochaetaceae bacterium]|jgi:HD-like signal output (HDOD) protein|nr:HDOD domain-containing protein [Spirochaetaceae bacterium]
MPDDTIAKIRQHLERMPSLPITVAKVLEICDNPRTRPSDLNRVIALDPVLVGRLIKLVNSAYFGGGRVIHSLTRAIVMLGINTVKNMALSAAVLATLGRSKEHEGLGVEGFWRHSVGVGVASKLIAKQRGIDIYSLEEYFTAGLLHDIGKIPLNAALGRDYLVPVALADRDHISLHQAEKNICGIDHTEVGGLITQSWKLYGPVGDTIIWHHNYLEYDGDYRDLLYTVVLADWFIINSEIGFAGNRHPGRLPPKVWQYLKPNDELFAIIKPEVTNEINKASLFLEI